MSEVIESRGRTYVHPDLAGISSFYKTILTGNRLPEGKHSFSLGKVEIPTGPFHTIETTLTIQSLTQDNLENGRLVAQAKPRSAHQAGIIVLPKDLPGYVIKTNIIQREPRILFIPQMVADIRSLLMENGFNPVNSESDNIIVQPPYFDPELKFRIFFPNRLDTLLHVRDATEKFAIKYYTFPMNVRIPRLASTENFQKEADLYFYGLDTLLDKLYETLATTDPSINTPNLTFRLKAPHLNVIDL